MNYLNGLLRRKKLPMVFERVNTDPSIAAMLKDHARDRQMEIWRAAAAERSRPMS